MEVEARLAAAVDIPVFHDGQHGTAIVVLAALRNALRVVGKSPETIRVTINGAGAAGIAIARLLGLVGVSRIVVCDRAGAIYRGRTENMNPSKQQLAESTNPDGLRGSLAEAVAGADAFIGVSTGNVLSSADIQRMGWWTKRI